MVKRRSLLTVAVAMTLTVAATTNADAAGARDDVATVRDLPPLTPKNRPRIMTMMDATSTSDCIGRPVTPLCAVETEMACFLRNDDSLCEVVGRDGFGGGSRRRGPPMIERYLISRSTIVDDRHFPWPPLSDFGQPTGVPSVRAGDVRIDVRRIYCYGSDATLCPDCYYRAQVYILRKQQGWWRLLASYPIGEWPRY